MIRLLWWRLLGGACLTLLLLGLPVWGTVPAYYTLVDLGVADRAVLPVLAKDAETMVIVREGAGGGSLWQLYPMLTDLGAPAGGRVDTVEAVGDGRIVGIGSFPDRQTGELHTQPYLRTASGSFQELATFAPELGNVPRAVNATYVAGVCSGVSGGQVPCVWGPTLQPMALPTFGDVFNDVTALNAVGDMTGVASVSGMPHCALWSQSLGLLDCHPAGQSWSQGRDVNDAAVVVGQVVLAGPAFGYRGFTYTHPQGATLLPPLPGDTQSDAYSLNDAGLVVGESWMPGVCGACPRPSQHAVIWDAGTPYDLQERLQGAGGWTLVRALRINAEGRMLGLATTNGVEHMVLLVPVEPTFKGTK
jgi:hypothetical protein